MVIRYSVKTPKNTIQFCVDGQGVVWKSSPKFPWMENMHINTVIEMCKRKGWELNDEFNSFS